MMTMARAEALLADGYDAANPEHLPAYRFCMAVQRRYRRGQNEIRARADRVIARAEARRKWG